MLRRSGLKIAALFVAATFVASGCGGAKGEMKVSTGTLAKPKSLAAAVRIEVSVESAVAGSGLRRDDASSRTTSSVTKCWASAAEPPLPQAWT